jgi:hypothetical protein
MPYEYLISTSLRTYVYIITTMKQKTQVYARSPIITRSHSRRREQAEGSSSIYRVDHVDASPRENIKAESPDYSSTEDEKQTEDKIIMSRSTDIEKIQTNSAEKVCNTPLSKRQKEILLEYGFTESQLNKMRFQSHEEAYAWCGQQWRNKSKKRKLRDAESLPPASAASQGTPKKHVRLSLKQKDLLLQCGFNEEELDQMRFSTISEGYNFVGRYVERVEVPSIFSIMMPQSGFSEFYLAEYD